VTIGVRPEDIEVSTDPAAGFAAQVDLVEELGADGYLYGHTELAGTRTDFVVRVDGRTHPAKGDMVYLTPKPDHLHIFDETSGERILAETAK
jgi:multiple sugar transport system ATP-binding protein